MTEEYDKYGFNKKGIHKDTKTRRNLRGFNQNGIHFITGTGFNKDDFDIDEIHKVTKTKYDEKGLDILRRLDPNRTDFQITHIKSKTESSKLFELKIDSRGFDLEGTNVKTKTKFAEDGWSKELKHQDTNSIYDSKGYDFFGFHKCGIHRITCLIYGLDGWSKYGINEKGFLKNGLHKNGTKYDDEGFDINGYNEQNLDRNGNKRPIEDTRHDDFHH